MEKHHVLNRQLKRCNLTESECPQNLANWNQFIDRINRAYYDLDQERYLSERLQKLSSAEMQSLYNELQKNAQLQAIFDNIAEAIVVLDFNNNVITINKTYENLYAKIDFEMSPKKMLTNLELILPNGEVLTPDQWPNYRAIRGEYVRNYKISIRNKKTGKMIYVEFNTGPIRNDEGKINHVIICFRDLTEHKYIETLRDQLAEIVESSNDAIIGQDLNGMITSWNRAAEKLFGYSASEILGQSIKCLFPSDQMQEETVILNKIQRGEYIERFDFIGKRKDGILINISITISLIKNSENKIIGVSKIIQDITEKKLLEEQLHQSQKMQAIGQLTGGIAHDFNNLLGIILGNLDLLKRLVEKNKEAFQRVKTTITAAMRGADLTKRLLTFSSLQHLKPAPTSLEECIHNSIEMVKQALGPEIKIITQLDKSLPPVFVDASELENTLLNLVINGRDAMPKGGTLTISTCLKNLEYDYPAVRAGEIKRGIYACTKVSDTGHGMSRDTMQHMFEPFFTTKSRGKGTGLGLSMVYGFIRQSGGTIKIYSEQEHGTTVTFYLPITEGIPLRTATDTTEMENQSTVGGIVLIVDDETDLLEVASTYLKEMGYTVLEAMDAKSALMIVEREPNIDLLITDIIMPGGMNGIELAKKIRQQNKNIAIIYSSGFPAEALAERSGIIDAPLISKPYQRNEFSTIIRRTMANHHRGS